MRLNILLLAIAYAIGQGSLFLAQSWLVLSGKLEFVGQFGLVFSIVGLASMVVDWGGLVLLARNELAPDSEDNIDRGIWGLISVRCLVAAATLLALLLGGQLIGDVFSRDYLLAASLGLVLSALGVGGVLDGLHRSGWTGFTTMLPYLTSGIALVVCIYLPSHLSGFVMGGAYSLGMAAGTSMQYGLLRLLGRRIGPFRTDLGEMRAAFAQGWLILMTQLPGQLFFRFQLSAVAWLLGPSATGILVYAKQVSSAALQGIYFVRRAEFPRLMQSLKDTGTLKDALVLQRGGIASGALISAALSVGGAAIWGLRPDEFGQAAGLVAAFGPAVFTGGIYAALTQIFVGARRFSTSALVGNSIIGIGCVLTVVSIEILGILGVPTAECMIQIIGIVWLLRAWNNKATARHEKQTATPSGDC